MAWLLTRRGVWSSRGLHALDVGVTFTIGAFFALMGATLTRSGSHLVDEPRVAMLTATLAVAMTMMWRAIALPSPPRRTAVLTALGVAPLIVADGVVLAGPGAAGLVAPLFTAGWAILNLAACVVTSDVVYGLRREAQRARRLGQYTLDEKIGEGAMGVVYRASHAMLRRPDRDQAAAAYADRRRGPPALRAGGAAHGDAHAPEHRRDLRLRPDTGRRLLLRDGVPRRHRSRAAGSTPRRCCRPGASFTSCDRSAARSRRRTASGSSIATSSRPTSF